MVHGLVSAGLIFTVLRPVWGNIFTSDSQVNTPYQDALLICYQPIWSAHPINPTYQPTLSTPSTPPQPLCHQVQALVYAALPVMSAYLLANSVRCPTRHTLSINTPSSSRHQHALSLSTHLLRNSPLFFTNPTTFTLSTIPLSVPPH